MKFLVFLSILLFPTLGHSACVTRADLTQGVTMKVDYDYYKTYHFVDRGGDIIETVAYADRAKSSWRGLWGLYPQSQKWTDKEGEGRTEYRYGRDPVKPEPDMVWSGTIQPVSYLLSDPASAVAEKRRRWRYEFGPLTDTTIETCVYRTMTVYMTHGGSRRYTYGEANIYFIDLGLAVKVADIGSDLVYPVTIKSLSRGLK